MWLPFSGSNPLGVVTLKIDFVVSAGEISSFWRDRDIHIIGVRAFQIDPLIIRKIISAHKCPQNYFCSEFRFEYLTFSHFIS
jgi:hypothetical protein